MTTVVVLGMAHCGTTMLAECIDRLGVPMTLGGDRGHCEDAEVARRLRKQSHFESLVAERGGQTWGFKHPGGWRFSDYFGCLENPVYFAIYKDPVSVARRFEHNMRHIQPEHYVQETMFRLLRSLTGVQMSGLPVHYLSYLDAVRDPYAFVVNLIEAGGLSVTERQLHDAAAHIKPLGMSYA